MQSSIRIALFYVAILLKGSINVLQQYEAKGHPQCIENTADIRMYYDLCISTLIEGKLFTEGDLLDCQVVLFDFVGFCVFCE